MGRLGRSGAASLALAAVLAVQHGSARAEGPALAPWPREVRIEAEALSLGGPFQVSWSGYRDARLDRAAARFAKDIDRRAGLGPGPQGPALIIDIAASDPAANALGAKEAYVLEIGPQGAKLAAQGPDGALRGLATLRQLVRAQGAGFAVPYGRIEDGPRFAWRGLMIDPVRHFVSMPVLKRQIDMMERVKLNVLHLHVSDNEGFRVESLRYPRLTEVASHGQYYTQAEIRELVTYAADRGVRIVPEIDVPGHTGAILTAYPELSAKAFDPKNRLAMFTVAMDPTKPETYAFLQGLFEEMAGLFPDAHFHVGGDEVSPAAWSGNPQIAAYMAERDIGDAVALQDHFFGRVKVILDGLGKTAMGWEEVAHRPISDDVVVQAWRSSEATAHAAAQGNRVVVSAGYYLDLLWPGETHYGVDPLDVFAVPPNLPAEVIGPRPARPLTPEEAARVIGAEAPMWSETITEEMVEGRLWPRAILVAERFWSPAEVRDPAAAKQRLIGVQEGLRLAGLDDLGARRRMAGRLAPADAGAVETLAAATAPVRNMGRLSSVFAALRTGKPPRLPQLNAPVDIAAPDSLEAYRLEGLVERFLRGEAGAEVLLRGELTRYLDNHPRFEIAARGVGPLEAALPISQDLASLSRTGLEAVDLIAGRKRASKAWSAQAAGLIGRQHAAVAASASIPIATGGAKQPPALLLIAITPSIEKLVAAAQGGPQ